MKIKCSIRGVDIELNVEKMCKILGIESICELVYQRKTWSHVEGFILGEAMQCICDLEYTNNISKPRAVGLTMKCHVIHNVVGHCIIPRGGHRDEVSYMEAFVIDSVVVRHQLHLEHMIIQHMIANCR